MFGNHFIKTYRQMQELQATMPFHLESWSFYGTLKAATISVGMKGLKEDLGVEVGV